MKKGLGKVALVGPGAVGGYYGAMLALKGYDVHFLFRSTSVPLNQKDYGWSIMRRVAEENPSIPCRHIQIQKALEFATG